MVEWKTLGDVAVIKNGKDYKNLSPGKIPVYGSGGIMTYVNQFASDKPSVLLPRKGSVENIFYVEEPFWTVDTIYWTDIDTSKIIPKYLYISLQQYDLKEFAYGGARPSLSQQILYNLCIPIPSLSEQTRIVGILDTFTASIDNLKEQITQRRKQYEHYRDQLLDLEGKEGVEMKTLGEIVSPDCHLSYGIVQPGDDVKDGVPVVRPVDLTSTYIKLDGLKKTKRQISESYKRTILKGNEILFCVRGTTGIMGLATSELSGCNVTRGIVPISFVNETTKMFVFYLLTSFRLQKIIDEKTNGTALRQINIKDLRLLNLTLPSLQEQNRIVSILDTFEASISNLEAQLKEREKQYEYYRNKLLTFE